MHLHHCTNICKQAFTLRHDDEGDDDEGDGKEGG